MSRRDLFDVELRPAMGSRFQPTGFPDIGAAAFRRPVPGGDGWEDCLLVESAQSMANRLEATCWDPSAQQPVAALEGLPWVRVTDRDGVFLSSSRTEAHRLAGAYVKDARLDGVGMKQVIKERLGLRDSVPLAPREIALAIFKLDPLCLIHGVFFAEKGDVWPGQPKVARALTAFVEAVDVEQATSGGVKRDEVLHKKTDSSGGATEGYGFVPFHRTEWVARRIIASFSLDRDQIASYGLPEPASEMLVAVARFEMRSLLDGGFRPRTACDLVPVDEESLASVLPSLDQATAEVRRLIEACTDLLGDRQPLTVTWDGPDKGK